MLYYREISPAPAFAHQIECFWTIRSEGGDRIHRVAPDGCADIILTTSGARATLDAVGPMTRYQDYLLRAGRQLFGVRFRPGRWPFEHFPDTVLPLEDLWGKTARTLRDRLADLPDSRGRAALIQSVLPPAEPGPVEHAIADLERAAGLRSIDDLARDANLSPRQFRRLCVQKSGYTPKFLARILRFRRAAALLRSGRPPVEVALDCGYYDQPHLYRDLAAFSGEPPSRFGRTRAATARER